jgi:molybdate transport system permease protein
MHLLVDIQKQLPNYRLEVTFELAGETLGILGSSGSGKSMTLRCIAGIETPTSGTIVLNHRILYDSRKGINLPSRDRKVGYLFQNYALFPHLTVAQNVAYGLKGWSKKAMTRRVSEHLEQMKLSGLSDRYPHQLSGGQQQRVALARALATAPDVLLLDEPFSALDTHLRNEMEKQLIKTLSSYPGLTLFVSHNLEEAYRVCQQLLVLSAGKVVAAGQKQAIFDHPGSVTVAQLTGCKNYSRIQPIAAQKIHALDWNCTLQTEESVASTHTHVGIRAHQLLFPETPDQPNTFPTWVVWTSETPHRMTLYLKLGEPPIDPDDYHLQAEVYKEKWEQLKKRPTPWYAQIHPQQLLLMRAD